MDWTTNDRTKNDRTTNDRTTKDRTKTDWTLMQDAAILNLADEEWESLKALREADGVGMSEGASADTNDNYNGALVTGNEMIGGTIDEGAV